MPFLVYKPRFTKAKLKSPIKDKPLRNPGESLDRKVFDVLFDDVFLYIMMSTISIILAFLEWNRWYFKLPPAPWALTTLALSIICYSIPKIFFGFKKAKKLKQGRDGEKAVGQYLEGLRETGAKVFHDIPGTNFNIDHVVVSASGVYVVETKTYSKPVKGETKILFNGENLVVYGKPPTDKPLIQVRAASHWLQLLLEESTGHKFLVRPVVVFPGWFIETTYEAKNSAIWVLNPKGLPTFIANSKEQLSPEQVKMIAFHLSRYVRTFQENK